VLAGLSGLLKTAAQENHHLKAQLILMPGETTTEELVRCLQREKSGMESLIRYRLGDREVLRWQEVGAAEVGKAAMVWKEEGVYLITGGLGALGVVFAKEILGQTRQARVVLTGRSALSREKQRLLEGLSGEGGRVSYRQVDLGDGEQVRRLIVGIEEEYGELKGILHSAGMIADNFILKKTNGEFSEVL